MDSRKTEAGRGGPEVSLDHATEGIALSPATELSRGVSDALADPIVRAVMAADRIDPQDLEELLRRITAWLSRHNPQKGSEHLTNREKPAASTGLAKIAKGIVLALVVIAGVSGAPSPAGAEEAPVAFIRALGDQAVSMIRSDTPLPNKAYYFNQMVRHDFDLTGISRFVLGPYWRAASPAERRQFRDGFADRLVHIYGQQLADIGDGDFVVTGSRVVPNGVVVTSRILRPQGAPIAVDWRLGIRDGVYKIEDVAIDGVSMALAQRSEIAALIARTGGQVGMLLAAMR
jgi:phospholipid transport system substrate-binding protein